MEAPVVFRICPSLVAWISLAVIAAAPDTSSAAVIEVPSDQPTITAAVAAAADGDTIRIAPGTYVENIDTSGKAITLTSHFEAGGDWSLVERTIIDGSSPDSATEASTVTIRSGESRSTVLQGLTITGGSGTQWVDPQFPAYTWHGGGGVFIFQSSPTIRYCIVSDNRVANDGSVDGAQGGGILSYSGFPLIHNTVIDSNEAEYGGGLVVDYSGADVRNAVISRNAVADSYGGGGIWVIGESDDPIDVTNCTIADNTSGSYGGGILAWNGSVSLSNSIVWGNEYGEGYSNIDVAGTGSVSINHSDVEGTAEGTGNLDVNPSFTDDMTYYLDPTSPCVDSGNSDATFNDPEDPSIAGSALWPSLGGLRNDMGAFGGPGAMAVSSAPPKLVFVPAAAVTEGLQGSFFSTDVEINNAGAENLIYRFLWLPRNTDNSNPVESAAFTLAPGASARYRNVLGEVFGAEDAVGALAVSAQSDAFFVVSRTANLTEGGSFGQSLAGVPAERLVRESSRARVLFMEQNDAFRSNIGLLNGTASAISITWELHASNGSVLQTGSTNLPPYGNTQINEIFLEFAPIQGAYVDLSTSTPGGAFTCYGSVLDNRTNDPTTILPQ